MVNERIQAATRMVASNPCGHHKQPHCMALGIAQGQPSCTPSWNHEIRSQFANWKRQCVTITMARERKWKHRWQEDLAIEWLSWAVSNCDYSHQAQGRHELWLICEQTVHQGPRWYNQTRTNGRPLCWLKLSLRSVCTLCHWMNERQVCPTQLLGWWTK